MLNTAYHRPSPEARLSRERVLVVELPGRFATTVRTKLDDERVRAGSKRAKVREFYP
jgi:hypothetical protein